MTPPSPEQDVLDYDPDQDERPPGNRLRDDLHVVRTSEFVSSVSDVCVGPAECLMGGWSAGAFTLPSDVGDVSIATAHTTLYTGRGELRQSTSWLFTFVPVMSGAS
jgi:hypothetical protein